MKIIISNHVKNLALLIGCIFCGVMLLSLQGCASSAAQRGAAGQADQAYLETDYAMRHFGESGGVSDAYQNANQTAKGVVIGGVVGAAAGSATSAIGGLAGFGLGAIFGGALGKYIDSHTTLADQLENRHVRVIEMGDQIMIVINSTTLFFPNTSNFRPEVYDTLDLVRKYINQYPNMSVKVAAYTSAAEPPRIIWALSEQQADKVMKYLWNRHINTRLLYAEGGGSSKLVTANTADWNSDNYRVEITLEKLPV